MSYRVVPRLKILETRRSDVSLHPGDVGWEPRLDHDGRVCAYTRADDGKGCVYVPGLASYQFSNGEQFVEALPEGDASANAIAEAFHRVALPMALHSGGYEVLHASAVSNARGVHVLCGASQSGKSTIAHALGSRGLEIWADDAVAFRADDGVITAVPLPFALRLRAEAADFFGVPADVERDASGKFEVLRQQAIGPRPVASVSLLERGQDSIIARLSSPESLPAVLYHAFYFSLDDPSVRRRMSTQFVELIASVPVFRVSLSPKLDAMAGLLDEFQQRVLAATTP